MVVDPIMALSRERRSEEEEAETRAVVAPGELLRFRASVPTSPRTTTGRATPAQVPGRGGKRKPGTGLVGPRLDQLIQSIETDIVPRLVMAQQGLAPVAPPSHLLGQADIASFTAVVLAGGTDEILAVVDEYRARGIALDRIYLDLFAPTARRLGQMWEDDTCDFASVTLGLHHLQGLLHTCRQDFAQEKLHPDPARIALLCPLPGEQHVFGLAIVGEFLRHAGWTVTDEAPASRQEMARLVQVRSYTIIGLTIGHDSLLETLTGCIRAVRRASRNRAIGVLVGGRIFTDRPELVALVGADAAAADGRSAVVQAERLRAHMAAGAPEQLS